MIRNVTIDGAAAHSSPSTTAHLEVDGIMVTAAPTQISNAAVVPARQRERHGTNVSMDHLQNTAGTGIRFVYVKGATQFTLRRGRWDFTSGNSRMTRIVVRAAGATDTVKISDLSMLKATAPYDTITSASFVDWVGWVRTVLGGHGISGGDRGRSEAGHDRKHPRRGREAAAVLEHEPRTAGRLYRWHVPWADARDLHAATTNQSITVPNDAAKKILTATGSDVVLTERVDRSRSSGMERMGANLMEIEFKLCVPILLNAAVCGYTAHH
ncbi:hypothetical protein GS432_12300 [Rhodococcus hoagii]|nr:hypothetical protein [Prescottella equi]